MRKIFFLLFLFLSIEASDFEHLYETISALQSFEMENEDSDLYYLLEKYYESPLDINLASKKELISLPFLNSSQVDSILKRRKKKPFTSLQNLVAWGYVLEEDFEILKHFLKVKRQREKKRSIHFDVINNIVIRHANGGVDGISFWEGRNLHQLTNDREYGINAPRIEHKMQFEIPQKLEANFTIQRDAYEESYVDLIKGSMWLKLASVLENIYLGALSVSLGQRLLFSTSTRNTQPYAGVAINHHKGSRLNIQRGTTENYLLGTGFDFALGFFDLHGFVGAFNYDGEVISSDPLSQAKHVRSLKTDQPHDSTNAIRQKNQQWEFLVGVNLNYHLKPASYVGLSLIYSEFLYPIKPELNDELDLYEFYGKRYWGLSLHWSIEQKEMFYFGEFMGYVVPALSHPQDYRFEDSLPYAFHPGGIVGFVYGEKRKLRTQLTFRYYSPYLLDFHSRGFTGGSSSRGEVGVYGGVDWRWHKQVRMKLFVDVRESLYPEISSGAEAEIGAKIDWKIYAKLKLAISPTVEIKHTAPSLSTEYGLKTDLSYQHSFFFIRLQGLFNQKSDIPSQNEQGLAGTLEIDVFPVNWFYLTTRYLIHNSELSLYTGNENISALFTGNRVLLGKGWGLDITTKFTIAKHYILSLKYGYAHRDRESDGEKITSISEEIQAQFRIKY